MPRHGTGTPAWPPPVHGCARSSPGPHVGRRSESTRANRTAPCEIQKSGSTTLSLLAGRTHGPIDSEPHAQGRESGPSVSVPLACWAADVLPEFENGCLALRTERREVRRVMAQQRHQVKRGTIPDAEPHHLRRRAPEHTQPMEVLVLRDQETPVFSREFPHARV